MGYGPRVAREPGVKCREMVGYMGEVAVSDVAVVAGPLLGYRLVGETIPQYGYLQVSCSA